jgi:hypothetical protein
MIKKVISIMVVMCLVMSMSGSVNASSIGYITYQGDEAVTWERTDPITYLEYSGGYYVYGIEYIPYKQAKVMEALKDDYSKYYYAQNLLANLGTGAAGTYLAYIAGIPAFPAVLVGAVMGLTYSILTTYDDYSFENTVSSCSPGDYVKVIKRYTSGYSCNVYSRYINQYEVSALRYRFYGDPYLNGEFTIGN